LARGAGRQRLAARNAQLDVVDLLARPRAGSMVYGMGKVDERGAVSTGPRSTRWAGRRVIIYTSRSSAGPLWPTVTRPVCS